MVSKVFKQREKRKAKAASMLLVRVAWLIFANGSVIVTYCHGGARPMRAPPPEKPSWSRTGQLRHFNAKPHKRFRPRIFIFHAWRIPGVLQISAAEMFCLRSIWKNWLVIQFKRTNLSCVKSRATFGHCNFPLDTFTVVEFLTFS